MAKKAVQISEYGFPENNDSGIVIQAIQKNQKSSHPIHKPHRDNHYQILFAFEGDYHIRIDFKDIKVKAPFTLYTEPGQVHQMVKKENASGWTMGIDPGLLEEEYKGFLDKQAGQVTPFKKGDMLFLNQVQELFSVSCELKAITQSVFIQRSVHLITNSILCLLIGADNNKSGDIKNPSKESRAFIIAHQFKELLKQKYKDWKSPFQYAEALSITPSHLNDTVKQVTGKSVSTQLQEQIITEAKRLLYFTDLDVKEIAYELGFEDPIYFGRLFKKHTAITPLTFRGKFRD